MNELPNIRHQSFQDIATWFSEKGEKKFRAKQLYEWIWKKHAKSFEDMSNLSKSLREDLQKNFSFPALSIQQKQVAEDGTQKYKFETADHHYVEGVIIPTEERVTACISSQIGCSLNCKFCATGYMKKHRSLLFDEIVDQVTLMNAESEKFFEKKLTNIVFMGMGEPLLNYKNMIRAVERITSEEGLFMSPRRITVSTAGIAKQIKKLGDDQVRFKLALSLHAANDKKRSAIMPINDTNDIKSLVEALNYFYQKTGNEITLEYILFQNFNDTQKDAEELVKLYRQIPADLVNIIEYNPIDQMKFSKPKEEAVQEFIQYLESHRVNARLRRSRGKDIDAACGQLANKKAHTA
ncbi:MAG: 23S rRNA (adenine(2503)-C(2))-methyltransferase RlmN [Bacteroidetes bacterium]|nr:23S rRNA (adenine(2503)-C(2))-methyltransferase RlmN [Bacteroidota bacterium]